MRLALSIIVGLALAVGGTLAIGGSSYSPPASSGSGVSGAGSGITDAPAFRSALGLGTAATASTGTGMGNVVVLGMGAKLPVVDASNLTGISSSQVSGLGTAAGYSAGAFEPADAELSALASLTSSADQLPYFSGSGTAALASFSSAGRALVDDADAAAQRTTLGLGTAATTASTAYEAADAELTAIAGLTSAADRVPYFTGSGTASLATVTTAARGLLDDATAADMRTTLGLAWAAADTWTSTWSNVSSLPSGWAVDGGGSATFPTANTTTGWTEGVGVIAAAGGTQTTIYATFSALTTDTTWEVSALIRIRGTGTNSTGALMSVRDGTKRVLFYVDTSNRIVVDGSLSNVSFGALATDLPWVRLTVRRIGGAVYCYANGVLMGVPAYGLLTADTSTPGVVRLGSATTTTQYYGGFGFRSGAVNTASPSVVMPNGPVW